MFASITRGFLRRFCDGWRLNTPLRPYFNPVFALMARTSASRSEPA